MRTKWRDVEKKTGNENKKNIYKYRVKLGEKKKRSLTVSEDDHFMFTIHHHELHCKGDTIQFGNVTQYI